MRNTWLISAVLLPWLITGDASGGGKDKANGPNICGLGILAPSGKVLFLPSAAGGIESVALFNGKTIWESKDASKPLLATDEKLFAKALVKKKKNQLKIVVLDARTGERLLESEAIVFPDWVSVTRDYGLRFHATGRLDKNDLILTWEARAFYDGGPPPPPGRDLNAKNIGGAFRVDLASGKLAEVKGYKFKAAEVPEVGEDTKRQGWMFRVEEKDPDPGFPHTLTRRLLKANADDGKRSWERPIAGEVFLPPRP